MTIRFEQTPIGEQGIIPGAEAITPSALARKRASEPLKPAKPQLACDVGLWSDEMDQVEMFADPTND